MILDREFSIRPQHLIAQLSDIIFEEAFLLKVYDTDFDNTLWLGHSKLISKCAPNWKSHRATVYIFWSITQMKHQGESFMSSPVFLFIQNRAQGSQRVALLKCFVYDYTEL